MLGIVRSLLNLWPTDDLRGNEVYVCYSDLVELFHNIGISGTVLTLCSFIELFVTPASTNVQKMDNAIHWMKSLSTR